MKTQTTATALQRFIDEHGLKAKAVAKRADLSRSQFYRICQGDRLPDTSEAQQIIKALQYCTGRFISIEHLWPPDGQEVKV
jgi:predicted transcriptional regulator